MHKVSARFLHKGRLQQPSIYGSQNTEFPTTSTCEDTLVTSSEPSVVSAEITHDEDVNTKTRAMSDKVKSDKSLPDIPAPRKPDNVTVTVPEEDRDLEKFYCDYCKYCFFTNEGLRQHMDNAHFRCLEEIYRDDPVYVDQRRSASKKFVNKQPASKYKSANDDDEEEDDFYYHCDKCSQKFDDWKELQKHKLDCVKVP